MKTNQILEIYFLKYRTEEGNQKYLFLAKHYENIYGIRCDENGENPEILPHKGSLFEFLKEHGNKPLDEISYALAKNFKNFLDFVYYSSDEERFKKRFKEIWNLLPKENISEFKLK